MKDIKDAFRFRVLGLVLVITLTLGVSVMGITEAYDQVDYIGRKQVRGYLVAPDDTITVYYRTDGRTATVRWWQGWALWAWGKSPSLFFYIYYQPRDGADWKFITSDTMFPWGTSLNLILARGTYVFVIKAYQRPSMEGGADAQVGEAALTIY